jgi:aerobic carbon-monoxide dehydrogenase large subunit
MASTTEVGQPRRRVEDEPLLRGQGRYLDDLRLPSALAVALVRSPYPAARIVTVDPSHAARQPGVFCVASADDPDLRSVPDLAASSRTRSVLESRSAPCARKTACKLATSIWRGVMACCAASAAAAHDVASCGVRQHAHG